MSDTEFNQLLKDELMILYLYFISIKMFKIICD